MRTCARCGTPNEDNRGSCAQCGAPLAADAAATHSGPEARRTVVIIALIAAVALASGIIAAVVARRGSDPRNTLESYLSAIQEGRFGDALGMEATAVKDTEKALLANGVVTDRASLLSDCTVSDGTVRDGTAVFGVSCTLGGKPVNGTIGLGEAGRKGLITQWKVTGSALSTIRVDAAPSGVGAIIIGGVEVAAADSPTRLYAYPATYTVSATASSDYVTVTPDADTVTVGGQVSLTVQTNDRLIEDINARLSEKAQSCIGQIGAGQAPDGSCAIDYQPGGDRANLTATLVGAPTVTSDSVEVSGSSAAPGILEGHFTSAGGAYAEEYNRDWGDGTVSHCRRDILFSPAADFTIDGDELTIDW